MGCDVQSQNVLGRKRPSHRPFTVGCPPGNAGTARARGVRSPPAAVREVFGTDGYACGSRPGCWARVLRRDETWMPSPRL